MFLRHARATRLAAAYLIFTVVLLMVPKADIPETLFDEANTPTNEMVVGKAASSLQTPQTVTTFVPWRFAEVRTINIRRISPMYIARLTDSRTLREISCFLLC
jgi:hypothetical protein